MAWLSVSAHRGRGRRKTPQDNEVHEAPGPAKDPIRKINLIFHDALSPSEVTLAFFSSIGTSGGDLSENFNTCHDLHGVERIMWFSQYQMSQSQSNEHPEISLNPPNESCLAQRRDEPPTNSVRVLRGFNDIPDFFEASGVLPFSSDYRQMPPREINSLDRILSTTEAYAAS